MKYDCSTSDTYNLYTITTDKFKSVHIELVFRTNATKENITYLSLLSSILLENSKKYPTRKLLIRKQSDLYNASINAINTRVGGVILSHFVIDVLDPKYTNPETFEESIELLFDTIFNPNSDNSEFDEKTFSRLKENLMKEIESIKEDPKQSCILSALGTIDKDDIRSMNASGDVETLKTMTPKKLYSFYLDFLEKSPRDIYVIGNVESKVINRLIKKYAKFKSIASSIDEVYLEPYSNRKPLDKESKSSLSQTSLAQVYSFDNLNKKERDYIMPLFNVLWGSGSLDSKLYKSLREENSLCYNVNTMYQKYDNSLILYTAIDDESIGLALKLIKKTLSELQKGEVEEQDLENAKNMMITSLHLILDNPNRIIDDYLFQNLVGLEPIEERIDGIRSVTIDDLIRISKKLKLIMTYKVRSE